MRRSDGGERHDAFSAAMVELSTISVRLLWNVLAFRDFQQIRGCLSRGVLVSGGSGLGALAHPAEAGSRGWILIVDDEILIRYVMADELRHAGYNVVEASSADEALTLLCAGLPADLLISDVRMPGVLDGVSLARATRVIRPDLAIALSSAHFAPGEGELLGVVNDYLPKPYLPQRLIEMVERLLGTEG